MSTLETNAPARTEALNTKPAPIDALQHAREVMLNGIRWHPRWDEIARVYQERIATMIRGESDPEARVVTRSSVPELQRRYGWTRWQVLGTLTALREHGIAWANPQYEEMKFGGRHQVGSVYTLRAEGDCTRQPKRPMSPARRDGAKRAAKTRRGDR